MSALLALVGRDLRLALRHGTDTLATLLFFAVAAVLFPFAVGPAPETLSRIAPGVVWVTALLAALLPLDRLFAAEAEDGSLDLLLLSPLSPGMIAMAKALAHWLTTGLPLLFAAAPAALLLRMDATAIPTLVIGLVPGTMALSLLGTAGAAIALGARRPGVLLPLLILPLMVPVLVFGVSAAEAAAMAQSPRPHLLLLCAACVLTATLAPPATAAALRNSTG